MILQAQSDVTDDEDVARKASEHISAIKRLIDAEKPAHTGYTLRVE